MIKRIAIAAAFAWLGAAPAAAECEWNGYPRAKLLVENNTTVPVAVYTTEAVLRYYEQRTVRAAGSATLENFLVAGRNRILVALTVDGARYEKAYGDIVIDNAGSRTCNRVLKLAIFARDFAGVVFPQEPGQPQFKATALGCMGDNRGADPTGTRGRDLDGHAFSSSAMTVELCVNTCAAQNFTHAGVQYGRWCFCGNNPGRYATVAICKMPCAGNAKQTCGGEWSNNVYRIER
jgi:hypothetical protein